MQKIVCELCGANSFVKQDGYFVCQYCGTKYSPEEAKKILIAGAVKIDYTDELNNLYELARRARDTGNSDNAQKYYEQILVKAPSDWEANFYSVYYQSMNCKIAEIQMSAQRIINFEKMVIDLVVKNVSGEDEQREIISEIGTRLIDLAKMLFFGARKHYDGIGYEIREDYLNEYINNGCSALEILYQYGNLIVELFDESYAKDVAVPCWEAAVETHELLLVDAYNLSIHRRVIAQYRAKIEQIIAPPPVQSESEDDYIPSEQSMDVEVEDFVDVPIPKKVRIGMISLAIPLIFFASIYAILALSEDVSMLGLSGCLAILGFECLILGCTPVKSTYLFGKTSGFKTKHFKTICTLTALFVLLCGIMSV